jgi:hypothetical protein
VPNRHSDCITDFALDVAMSLMRLRILRRTFSLEFDADLLSIVTDTKQWALFKTMYGLASPLEVNFMSKGGRQI